MSAKRNTLLTISIMIILMITMAAFGVGCSDDSVSSGGEGGENHGNEGGGEGGGEGEESGTTYSLTDTCNEVYNGLRLVMSYDAPSHTFVGTVTNITTTTLVAVRVEIHLSNGTELGPTAPADLGPGLSRTVSLVAPSTGFTGWSAHPEQGSGGSGS